MKNIDVQAAAEKAEQWAQEIVARYRAGLPAGFDPRNELDPVFDDAAAAVQKIRDGFSRFTVSLNAMKLPEALKPAVDSLTTEINGLMSKMQPLQAHKAGKDATYAINALNNAIESCQSAMDSAMGMCGEMAKNCMSAMNAKETAVNGLVETGVKTGVEAEITKRIGEGKLFAKEMVDGLVTTARGQGKDLALNGITVVNTRKTKLVELKLPLPDSDTVLEGDDAAFTTLSTTAKTRLDTLAQNGLTVSRTPDLVRRMIYAADFEQQLKNALDVLKVGGAGGGKSSSTTATGKRMAL